MSENNKEKIDELTFEGLLALAKNEDWDAVDKLIKEFNITRKIIDWALNTGIFDEDNNVRDLATTFLDNSDIDLKETEITILKDIMKKDIYNIVQFRTAIALYKRGDRSTEVEEMMQKAKDDPNSSDFSLMWCDGPSLASQPELLAAAKAKNGGRYTACDFAGAVGQIQHLMNIAVILGVLVAIILFSYAGYLMISVSFTGKQDDLKKAKDIFQKVTWGFIIMLVAWFAVYQIIAWLVPTNSPATTLLDQRL